MKGEEKLWSILNDKLDTLRAGNRLPEAIRVAETALDLACILYHIRQEQGLTQRKAAARAGLKQQAISRLEKAASNIQLGTLQRYLGALGYSIEISVIDNQTGKVAGRTSLSSA